MKLQEQNKRKIQKIPDFFLKTENIIFIIQ